MPSLLLISIGVSLGSDRWLRRDLDLNDRMLSRQSSKLSHYHSALGEGIESVEAGALGRCAEHLEDVKSFAAGIALISQKRGRGKPSAERAGELLGLIDESLERLGELPQSAVMAPRDLRPPQANDTLEPALLIARADALRLIEAGLTALSNKPELELRALKLGSRRKLQRVPRAFAELWHQTLSLEMKGPSDLIFGFIESLGAGRSSPSFTCQKLSMSLAPEGSDMIAQLDLTALICRVQAVAQLTFPPKNTPAEIAAEDD